MDDEGTHKAPVTRLRRRLSVETEELKSPSGVTTPTKKRGGRLAAKPQLDLIDENATENTSKRITRKAAAKAIVEPAEEMALTPSRRSARIKSNSSIVSETTTYESPRTRRAVRRLSQAGSDNEASSTPARQTRRIRKDSTSSIDKQVDSTTITKTPNISTAINEEIESNNEENSVTRKSPRLVGKKEKVNKLGKSGIDTNDNDIKGHDQSDNHNENPKVAKETLQLTESSFTELPTKSNNELNTTTKDKENVKNNSCENLLMDLSEIPQKARSLKNKSCTALDSSTTLSSKRNRTKSWTSITVDHSNYDNFYSDNEISKKKRNDKTKTLNNASSGDNGVFTKNNEKNKSINKLKEKSFTDESMIGYKDLDSSKSAKCNTSTLKSPKKADMYTSSEKDISSKSKDVEDSNPTAELFNNAPGIHVQTLVFIDEDSDSNTDIISKHRKSEVQDQCVPIVHQVHDGDILKNNISYEQMDVDETLPENVSINNLHENNTIEISESNKPLSMSKSMISVEEKRRSFNNGNKSKRKYSGTYLESQNLENTNNENKSTLILSQVKDSSSNDINASAQISNVNNNEQLSKSTNVSDSPVKRDTNKTNLSQNYLTSTPLQQKLFTKLGIQLDTSLISPKNVSKEQIDTHISLNDNHITNSDSHVVSDSNKDNQKRSLIEKSKDDSGGSTSEEESEVVTSRKQNSMIAEEAEEASDDYESGDSQNDEDREYEMNNEIIEKGETLETDEDFSEDSDYEKDSFVVSSAEEDNELLSGSGDNLSMSDNELKMSSKSKKKYNERKIKEQKKASREMYNARHGLNESQSSDDKPKTKKSKRQRLDSSTLKSDDEQEKLRENSKTVDHGNTSLLNISSKKKKKVRALSESVELSDNEKEKSSDNLSIKKKNKKMPLLESECDEELENEKEITIFDTSKFSREDPLLVQIKEEKQSPQKSFNISAVPVNDAVEEVNVNEDISVTNPSQSLDPLQCTVAIDDEEYLTTSEDEKITENYNSILKNLNENTKKIKSIDISLNEEKRKKKIKEPLVDELNLTLTKTRKNKEKFTDNVTVNDMLQAECRNTMENSLGQNEDDKASDSIDMRLLFPEDSNDSEQNCDKLKETTRTVSSVSGYMPLEGTEDKANIVANEDNELNENLPFFIDTKGMRNEDMVDDISNKCSPKKSRSKNKSCDLVYNDGETDESPLETTYSSNKKKRDKFSSQTNTSISEDFTQESTDISVKSSGKKNKKTKLFSNTSMEELATQIDLKDSDDTPVDTKDVTHSDKKKKKHGKKHTDQYEGFNTEIQTTDFDDTPVDTKDITHSDKKKNKHSKKNIDLSESVIAKIQTTAEPTTPGGASGELDATSSTKKKKKGKQSQNVSSSEFVGTDVLESDAAPDEVLYSSDKKKKHSIDNLQSNMVADTIEWENTAPEESPANISSSKKKKKSKKLQDSVNLSSTNTEIQEILNTEEAPEEVFHHSNKKKKHSTDNVQSHIEAETKEIETTAPEEAPANISSGKKKKKSKKLQDSFADTAMNTLKQVDTNPEEASIGTSYQIHKKKKHDKQFLEIHPDTIGTDVKHSEVTLEENVKKEVLTSKKRKRELLAGSVPVESNLLSETTSQGNETKKRKTFQNNENTGVTEKKHKKRKQRDDEGPITVSKVFKQSSADKVYVQRLPSHILNQLEDKPKKDIAEQKKTRVISTTEFTVEDQRKAKRNKPSNYLEESVYLNDSPVLKKEKKNIKKPKVLPFIPTASTSDEGFTTNFRINTLPGDNQFVAQSTNITDFRTDFLRDSKLKKFRTFEKYKSQRKYKISKF